MSQFTIQSLVTYPFPYVGITTQGQSYAPVQLNPSDNRWSFQNAQLTIGGFSYTGVDNNNVVIATNDNAQSVQWLVVSGCGPNEYNFIDPGSNQLWTTSGPSGASQIVLRPQISSCDPAQLFQINQVN